MVGPLTAWTPRLMQVILMQYRTCKGGMLTGSIDQVCGHTLQPQTHQSGSVRLATPANQIP